MLRSSISWVLVAGMWALPVACTSGDDTPDPDQPEQLEVEPEEPDNPELDIPALEWDGECADDAAADIAGEDADFYWEANTFTNKVTVTYADDQATVTTNVSKVQSHVEGAHVTIDLLTNSVKNVEIVLKGRSNDGSLKIYSEKKFKVTLDGVELHSNRGPAINNQCKKRMFVHVADGTVNMLTDVKTYSDDTFYLNGATSADEDRKGTLFSESALIFSGHGVLSVAGRAKHAIATDDAFVMRPGTTIAVTEAVGNGVQVKGNATDSLGVRILGGLIHAKVASTAGKCIKTDRRFEMSGGRLHLFTTGGSEYVAAEADTSSPSCVKVDENILISGGTMILSSTGNGGKGISVDGDMRITGGVLTIQTSGGQYVYNNNNTSSLKGIKVDGALVIEGGDINVSVTGRSEGSEGIESKSTLTVHGGNIGVYAYDDAVNAASDVMIDGGRVFCQSIHNDGIDSNGTIHLAGGLVMAVGASAPEEAFDCDQSSRLTVTGGTLIGMAGAAVAPSTATTTQNTVVYGGLTAQKDQFWAIRNSAGEVIAHWKLPFSMNNMALFFSAPELKKGDSYTILSNGTLTGAGEGWNGWYAHGTWSGGSSIGSFTVNNTVTTVGSTGGGPGGPGGGRPGRP